MQRLQARREDPGWGATMTRVGPDERYGEPGQRRIVLRVYDLGGVA